MNKIVKTLIVVILLLFCGSAVFSQQKRERPKIGLALSGGGSFGMSHIGVLKVMEEAGLRPDYITGVSMGSIVGAMYSIGYNADSLHKVFKSTDWSSILSNNIPEDKVIFTDKKYYNNSILSFPISSRKVRFPSGLINGQQIEKMLSYYAWPAARINDFSKLPIPFLCIGTDLISCRKVVMKSGYLPDALRASMAVPSIFAPVKIDSAVLIDGGFVRNIAVSELKEMGADIVIGSYTGFNRYSENELQSMTGVLKQLSFFNSINDYAVEKNLIDFLIEPNDSGLSSAVFTNVETIVQRGYKSALPFREKFKRLADSLNQIGPQKPVEFLKNVKSYTFDRIEINGNDIIPEDQILGMMEIKAGKPVDKDFLNDKIDLLYGWSWFDKVKYTIVPGNDSLKLVIDCIEKPQAMLYGAVHYDNFMKEGVIINLSAKNILSDRSALDIGAYIGQYYRFRFSLTQFLGRNQASGLTAYFFADNTPLPFLELRGQTGQLKSRSYITGLSLNKRIGLNQLMSISTSYNSLNLVPDFISEERLRRVSYNYLSVDYLNQINTLDTKHFPNRGVLFQVSINTSRLLSGRIKTDFSKIIHTSDNPDDFLFKRAYSIAGDFWKYFSPGRKITLSIGGDALFSYTADSVTSPHNYYFLGGAENVTSKSVAFAGFHNNEIPVDRFGALKFGADFEFRKDLHLDLMTNFAVAREISQNDDLAILGGYGLGIGYMSVIGPIKIGIMHGFGNRDRYFRAVKGYINIGFSF